MQRENITEGWVGMVKVLVPWTWTGKRTRGKRIEMKITIILDELHLQTYGYVSSSSYFYNEC